MKVLVAEIGGTTMRAARYEPGSGGRLSERRTAPTPNHLAGVAGPGAQQEVVAALAGLGATIESPAAVGAGGAGGASGWDVVALAYPGPMNDDGIVLAAPTVVGPAEPFDLPAVAGRVWPGSRLVLLNDLSAAGYRYVSAGWRDFAIITVGSGIGHKVFLDGRPVTGVNGRGGEIGHLRVDFAADTIPCECGGLGHVGGLGSGRGVAALVRRGTGRELTGPEIVRAYRSGAPDVVASVALGARYLGMALAAIHLDTGVERIVVQGGFAQAMGPGWLAEVAAAADAAGWPAGPSWPDILQAGYPDDDSALLGAGWLATGGAG